MKLILTPTETGDGLETQAGLRDLAEAFAAGGVLLDVHVPGEASSSRSGDPTWIRALEVLIEPALVAFVVAQIVQKLSQLRFRVVLGPLYFEFGSESVMVVSPVLEAASRWPVALPSPDRRPALAALLESIYSEQELRVAFARLPGPDVRYLDHQLPGPPISCAELAWHAADLLVRTGNDGAELRDFLMNDRPRRAREIEAAFSSPPLQSGILRA